jgi:hypothetical protein
MPGAQGLQWDVQEAKGPASKEGQVGPCYETWPILQHVQELPGGATASNAGRVCP